MVPSRLAPPLLAALALCVAGCRRSSLSDLPLWRVEADASGKEVRVVRLPFEQTSYDMARHSVVRKVEDRNQDGFSDRITSYDGFDGARVEESDTNFDAEIDRWDTFGPEGQRLRSATSRVGARPDRVATYDRAGSLSRVESDTDLDGRFELTQIFEGGRLAEARIDSDGNGRADRIQDFRPGYLRSEDFDTDGDGAANLRMTYSSDGAILKIAVLKAMAR